jgi:hypothetical protein
VEGDEEGYDEEYPLEVLEISPSDFMSKVFVGKQSTIICRWNFNDQLIRRYPSIVYAIVDA